MVLMLTLKDKDEVLEDIKGVVKANGNVVKVIIETCYLTENR